MRNVAIGGLFALAGVLLTVVSTVAVEWLRGKRERAAELRRDRLRLYTEVLVAAYAMFDAMTTYQVQIEAREQERGNNERLREALNQLVETMTAFTIARRSAEVVASADTLQALRRMNRPPESDPDAELSEVFGAAKSAERLQQFGSSIPEVADAFRADLT